MSKDVKRTYATIIIEIEGDNLAVAIDRLHRWRKMNNRPSTVSNYKIGVINWRIPTKRDF